MNNPLFVSVNLEEVELRVCKRCGQVGGRIPIERHHITYNPEKTVALCQLCHTGITVINTWRSAYWGGPLRNRERIDMHKWYMRIKWRMQDEKEIVRKVDRGNLTSYYEDLLPKLRKRFMKKFRYE